MVSPSLIGGFDVSGVVTSGYGENPHYARFLLRPVPKSRVESKTDFEPQLEPQTETRWRSGARCQEPEAICSPSCIPRVATYKSLRFKGLQQNSQ